MAGIIAGNGWRPTASTSAWRRAPGSSRSRSPAPPAPRRQHADRRAPVGRANKAPYNIRVLNLSLGTDSTQSYTIDPLDYAVEKAWQAGIVVNVAAVQPRPGGTARSAEPGQRPVRHHRRRDRRQGHRRARRRRAAQLLRPRPDSDRRSGEAGRRRSGRRTSSRSPRRAPRVTTQFPSTMAAPYRRGSGTSMATGGGLRPRRADAVAAAGAYAGPGEVRTHLDGTHDASNDRMATGSGIVDGFRALNAATGVANVGVTPSTGHRLARRFAAAPSASSSTTPTRQCSTHQRRPHLGAHRPARRRARGSATSWFGTSWFGDRRGSVDVLVRHLLVRHVLVRYVVVRRAQRHRGLWDVMVRWRLVRLLGPVAEARRTNSSRGDPGDMK